MLKKQLLCGLLAAATLTTTASAYRVPHANETENIIVLENANCDPQSQAEMLKALGLFLGTDKGFELDRAMTRAEAAAMLYRFLGGDADSSSAPAHPFNDVPTWASDAVGWLYQNKLTYGISVKQYGASQPVTASQYAAFLSRAICGNDDIVDRILPSDEANRFTETQFLRSHAVALSVRALATENVRTNQTLAQTLIDKGVFTAGAFLSAAWDILPPSFTGELKHAEIAGVPYADNTLTGLFLAGESATVDLPYFYAIRVIGGQQELYQFDWKMLTPTLLDTRPALGDLTFLSYRGTIGGKDYLYAECYAAQTGRLYSVTNKTAVLELSEDKIGPKFYQQDNAPEGTLAFQLETGMCIIDAEGVHLRGPEPEDNKTETLYTGTSATVRQTVTYTETLLTSTDPQTGKTISSYTIPHDTVDGKLEARTVQPEGSSTAPTAFLGEGGYYRFDPQTGTIEQLFDTAVNLTAAAGTGNPILYVTHTPGKRVYGMASYGGDTIVCIDQTSGARETWVDESAGISIAGFTDSGVTASGCEFFSADSVGMMHFDQYTYYYDRTTKKITVRDFSAGRPETITGWDYQNPTAYKAAYIEQEQARLDAAWNNKH